MEPFFWKLKTIPQRRRNLFFLNKCWIETFFLKVFQKLFHDETKRLLQGVLFFRCSVLQSDGHPEACKKKVFKQAPIGNEEKPAWVPVLYKVSSEMTGVDFCLRCHQNFASKEFISEKACSLKTGQRFSSVDPNRKFLSTSSVKKHVPFMAQKPTSTTPFPPPPQFSRWT